MIGRALILISGFSVSWHTQVSSMGMMGMRSRQCPMMRNIIPETIKEKDLPEHSSEEARVYARVCSECHSLPSPKRYSKKEWKAIFERMDRRTRMCRMTETMTKEEKRLILGYLERNAMKSIEKKELPYPEIEEAQIFKERCSECHDLPDPTQHTPQEWVKVIEGMQQIQENSGEKKLTDAEKGEIMKYLNKSAYIEKVEIGKKVPDFSLSTLNGSAIRLYEYFPNRVVILWFTNLCDDSKANIPILQELYKKYKTQVEILAISVLGEDRDTVEKAVKEFRIKFPFLIDPDGEVCKLYGEKYIPNTCPLTNFYIIDKNGILRFADHFPGIDKEELEAEVSEVLERR